MSPQLAGQIVALAGPTHGAVIGALVGSSWTRWSPHQKLRWAAGRSRADGSVGSDESDDEDPTEEARTPLTAQFQQHAAAVAAQVGNFADELAAGDPLLRARLRRIERRMGRRR